MKLTPLDIRHREFRRAIRGYADEEVDLFLDEVADEFERLYRENIETMERVERLEEQVSQFDQLKETLQHTLITAQKQADDVKVNARKEAELMLRDAELKGRDIMADSYSEKQRVEQALIQLRQVEEDFRFKFRSLLEAHINLLTEDDTSEDRRRFRGIVSQVEEDRSLEEAVEPDTAEDEAPEPAAAEAMALPAEQSLPAGPAGGEERELEWDAQVDARPAAPAAGETEQTPSDAVPEPTARAAYAAVVWDAPVATDDPYGPSGEDDMPAPVAQAVEAAKAAGGFGGDDLDPVYERDAVGDTAHKPRRSLFGRPEESPEADGDPFATKEARDFEW